MTTDIWTMLFIHLGGTVTFAWITYAVRSLFAKRSVRDRFIGWVVFALSVGGYFAAGSFEIYQVTHSPSGVYWGGTAMFGFLVGLLSGNVLGHLIWTFYGKEIEQRLEDTSDEDD